MSEEPLRIVIEIERAGEHYRATRQFSTFRRPRQVNGLKLGPQDTLQRILLSHRDDFAGLSDGFIELAVERFLSLRSRALYKAPSTGELLVWLRVLAAAGNVSEAALREADPSRIPYLGVLLKNRQDLLERE